MDAGLRTIPSRYSVRETADRLGAAAEAAGLRVFARIDHGGNAAEVGLDLRPTELVLFGHPRGGTPWMEEVQTVGLDLPLRALAWEDADGRVWLTHDEVRWTARRHGLAEDSPTTTAIEQGLAQLTRTAAGSDG